MIDKGTIYRVGDDGVTHIQIDRESRSRLGRILAFDSLSPFEHPEYGYFKSLSGFIGWANAGADVADIKSAYRFAYGERAQSLLYRQVRKHPALESMVRSALISKICQKPGLIDLIKENYLPLLTYAVWDLSLEQGNAIVPGPRDTWLTQEVRYIAENHAPQTPPKSEVFKPKSQMSSSRITYEDDEDEGSD